MTNGQPPAPPRVDDVEKFWTHAPPEPSPRLLFWMDRIKNKGWRPNKRVGSHGYYGSAEYYGVYIWEYINVISAFFHDEWMASRKKETT